ncbi:MAG TPA: glucosyl-3-phosphoglycerate synthase [Jatrophihabitantaceae bacterium]|nr:glucosyl-3-phosphoglycerate synthase [Jatrophihabitantaceae bacterium]
MHPDAAGWFERATSRCESWPAAELVAAKGTTRISVVIPARDEVATIGGIVAGIRTELMQRHQLVDELVVIDSDSSDDTAQVARAAGAQVHEARSVRPDLGTFRGKGEALWKSQFVTSGDLLIFIDADLTQWGTHFVSGLVGPLLASPSVSLVKGFYDRLLDDGSPVHTPQGGRVTELVARPLINLRWPGLAAVVQPLAGEWAVRRSVFETLSVPVGYGVEIAVLLDVFASAGIDAIAQVDLGSRAHAHQSVHDLGVMATELLAVAGRRLGLAEMPSHELWQFDRASSPPWRARTVPAMERPPATSVSRRNDAAIG